MDSVASRVEVNPSDDGWSIVGEVDASTAPTVAEALAVIPDGGRKSGRIVVESSGVSFIDSSGLRVLIELSERATALGALVVLAAPSRSMIRLVELTGLNDLFVIETAAD
jgi:anti-sigma B factor antagonist